MADVNVAEIRRQNREISHENEQRTTKSDDQASLVFLLFADQLMISLDHASIAPSGHENGTGV